MAGLSLPTFMQAAVRYILRNNTFWLSPCRCIFWEEQRALILSDLHFGKTGHFRKSGIAVPQAVFKEDLQRLFSEIQLYQPKQLFIVGDLFHSRENKELDLFIRWRNDLQHVELFLIKGNHDILKNNWYKNAGICVMENELSVAGFLFTHDVCHAGNAKEKYCFSGHIHPGISMKGLGKQSLTFPCFYFGEAFAILPAFSKFTGLALIEPEEKGAVFAIVDKCVIALN